jgi:hypothetical protein
MGKKAAVRIRFTLCPEFSQVLISMDIIAEFDDEGV